MAKNNIDSREIDKTTVYEPELSKQIRDRIYEVFRLVEGKEKPVLHQLWPEMGLKNKEIIYKRINLKENRIVIEPEAWFVYKVIQWARSKDINISGHWVITGEGDILEKDTIKNFKSWVDQQVKKLNPQERLKFLVKIELCFPEFATWRKLEDDKDSKTYFR